MKRTRKITSVEWSTLAEEVLAVEKHKVIRREIDRYEIGRDTRYKELGVYEKLDWTVFRWDPKRATVKPEPKMYATAETVIDFPKKKKRGSHRNRRKAK